MVPSGVPEKLAKAGHISFHTRIAVNASREGLISDASAELKADLWVLRRCLSALENLQYKFRRSTVWPVLWPVVGVSVQAVFL